MGSTPSTTDRLKQLRRACEEAVQAVKRAEQHHYPPHVAACLRVCDGELHKAHLAVVRALQSMSAKK